MKTLLLAFFCGLTAWVSAQSTCATAVPITAVPFNSGNLTTCGSGNDYASGTLFDANYGDGEDYVFSISITNAPVNYLLTLGGTATWKIASVHSACPPTATNAIGGVVTSSGTTGSAVVSFPANGTYYIIVDTWPTPDCGGFTLNMTVPPPAPLCTTNISPANGATNVAYLPGIQISWNAVASATSYNLFWSSNNGTSYTNLGNTTATTIAITGTTPNTTYYWYIQPVNGVTPAVGCQSNATSLTTGAVPAPPSNDNCSSATTLIASNTSLCGTPVAGTTVSATASTGVPAPSCSVTGVNDDVWYSFVATATTHRISLTDNLNTLAAAVYSGANCSSLTQISGACATGGPTVSGLTINTTYYIRVYTTTATATTFSNFNICIGVPPPPPANDSCGLPVALTQGVAVAGTNISTSQSLPPTICEGNTGTAPVSDVWYAVNATSNGTASIAITGASSSFDAVVHAYSGVCGSLTNIGCADITAGGGNETLNLTGLVAGQTYLIRVYGYNGGVGTFTITATGPALPVTGVNLSAIRNGKTVQLGWKTETEVNNAGFQVQRSADGKEFTSILSVASKANNGNSTSAINYNVDDAKPFMGANYYRLKQTDKDGKISYSNVVYLKGLAVNNLTVSAIYPNPTKDVLKAAVQSPAAETITFVITDMTGKVVARQNAAVTSGDNTINLNVANLANGSYLLKAICANGCETVVQKFTKQ